MSPSPTSKNVLTYFKFACVYCGQHIECVTGLSGRQIKCPSCQARIVVPAEEKGKSANKQPMTKFTWDTVVPLPEVKSKMTRNE